jgi:hypothetical protein
MTLGLWWQHPWTLEFSIMLWKRRFGMVVRLLLWLGVCISGSVRFWAKINNQIEIIFFQVLEPNRTENRFKPTMFGPVRFGFFSFQTV